MSIGTSFEQAMMKAVRSIELGIDTMNMKKFEKFSTKQLLERIANADDAVIEFQSRIFYL
jgi:carbamoyl-phosphate synthase large subunit